MQISSGQYSVQLLRAQQAFQATRTSRPAVPEQQPAVEDTQPVQQEFPAIDTQSLAMRSQDMQQRLSEVKEIAQRAGFVGLSDQDIQRAYVHGNSLLADYRA